MNYIFVIALVASIGSFILFQNVPDNGSSLRGFFQIVFDYIIDAGESNLSALPLNDLSIMLKGSQFKGTWHSESENDQFNFLTVPNGNAFMIFTDKNYFPGTESSFSINRLELQLLNPKYLEDKQVVLFLDLDNYNDHEISWRNVDSSQISFTGREQYKIKVENKCQADYFVKIDFSKKSTPSVYNSNIQISITNGCHAKLRVHLSYDATNYQLQIILYCTFVSFLCAIQFLCVFKLCKNLIDNPENQQKLSLLTIGFLTVYDSYLCLQNLYYALLNYMFFQYFIIPSFFYFILSTSCDMKLMWIVWRARYMDDAFDNQQLRRAIQIFFVQFYASLLTFFVLMYFFSLNNWFMLETSLFILPQIIHNAIQGKCPKFMPEYIFGTLTVKMIYPLYFRGCPENFRGMIPSPMFCSLWISSFALQLFIILIQHQFGARSFLPKWMLPKQFNYYQDLKLNDSFNSYEDHECAICLTLVTSASGLSDEIQNTLVPSKVMVTPCNHIFHISCLKSWMEVKLQCPSCRSKLPPLE